MKRVFKLKTFSRWARRILTDDVLCMAAREIERGIFEADLGGGLCKKRVASAGRGKSGSARILVAKGHPTAIFFVVGRAKSDPGRDFSDRVIDAAKSIAAGLGNATAEQLGAMLSDRTIEEICGDGTSEGKAR